jgi:hypothetical protein
MNTALLAGALGPAYLWLIGTAKVSLEANPLNGENCTRNKLCKQELIWTATVEVTTRL